MALTTRDNKKYLSHLHPDVACSFASYAKRKVLVNEENKKKELLHGWFKTSAQKIFAENPHKLGVFKIVIRNRTAKNGTALGYYVNLDKSDWYHELCKDIDCERVTTITGEEIDSFERECFMDHAEFFCEFKSGHERKYKPPVRSCKYAKDTDKTLCTITQNVIDQCKKECVNYFSNFFTEEQVDRELDSAKANETISKIVSASLAGQTESGATSSSFGEFVDDFMVSVADHSEHRSAYVAIMEKRLMFIFGTTLIAVFCSVKDNYKDFNSNKRIDNAIKGVTDPRQIAKIVSGLVKSNDLSYYPTKEEREAWIEKETSMLLSKTCFSTQLIARYIFLEEKHFEGAHLIKPSKSSNAQTKSVTKSDDVHYPDLSPQSMEDYQIKIEQSKLKLKKQKQFESRVESSALFAQLMETAKACDAEAFETVFMFVPLDEESLENYDFENFVFQRSKRVFATANTTTTTEDKSYTDKIASFGMDKYFLEIGVTQFEATNEQGTSSFKLKGDMQIKMKRKITKTQTVVSEYKVHDYVPVGFNRIVFLFQE